MGEIKPGGGMINKDDGTQNADSVMNLVRGLAKEEKFEDTGPEGRPFLDGSHYLFGYDRVVVEGGKITKLISSKGDEPELTLGMEVVLSGDSRGYVPSGHKSGEIVNIVAIAEPFRNNSSDRIIKVYGNQQDGWVKPSNIGVI